MKFLPSIVTLLLVTAWLGIRQHTTATIREEITVLERRIDHARTSTGNPAGDRSLASHVRKEREALLKPGEPIDWKRIADRFAASPGNRLEMRHSAILQQRVMEMSPDELVEALDEIHGLDLPSAIDNQLEGMLLGQLARKDPQQALEKYGDRIGSEKGHVSWQLTDAISRWAEDDPAAAGDWFDRKIAEGLFDSKSLSGRNQDRIRFEASMIGALLPGDTATAVKRLSELPDVQRVEILRQHWLLKLKPGEHLAYATLARGSLQPPDPSRVLGDTARTLVRGEQGYQRVDDFIQQIEASPEERKNIAAKVAEDRMLEAHAGDKLDIETIGKLHDWFSEQAPQDADTTIGKNLARIGADPERNVQLVTELHAKTGNDALLLAFLGTHEATANAEAYLPLVEKIGDPQVRMEIQERFDNFSRDSVESLDPGAPR